METTLTFVDGDDVALGRDRVADDGPAHRRRVQLVHRRGRAALGVVQPRLLGGRGHPRLLGNLAVVVIVELVPPPLEDVRRGLWLHGRQQRRPRLVQRRDGRQPVGQAASLVLLVLLKLTDIV